jgi:hypothetical protein
VAYKANWTSAANVEAFLARFLAARTEHPPGTTPVTFHRTAAELGLHYESVDFQAAFTIDIRGRQGDRSVRPHFQTVRVRAVVATAEPMSALRAVIEETEARCPVMNLLLDAKVDLRVEWVRDSGGSLETVTRR